MGMLATDYTPLGTQMTANTPSGKDVCMKAFLVARTDTVASVKMVLPADCIITDILIYGVASNAGTTATLSVGSTVTATEYVSAQDVKTAGGMVRPTTAISNANLYGVTAVPQGLDKQIWAKYAETGGASSAGNWTVAVFYVR